MTLIQKIAKIQQEVGKLKKNGNNKFGGYNYYKLDDIFEKLQELSGIYKVVFAHTDVMSKDVTITRLDKEIEISYWKEYSIVDAEQLGTDGLPIQIRFNIFACAKNSDIAKAKGSAETYAYRYFLMNLLLLSEDDLDPDNDKNSSTIKVPVAKTANKLTSNERQAIYNKLVGNVNFLNQMSAITKKPSHDLDIEWFNKLSDEKVDVLVKGILHG